jgi:hypothetical protein
MWGMKGKEAPTLLGENEVILANLKASPHTTHIRSSEDHITGIIHVSKTCRFTFQFLFKRV